MAVVNASGLSRVQNKGGACPEFEEAIHFALGRVGKAELVLKPEQLAAVRCIVSGKDVFVWLPTGFGKSLCYEVLPFVFDHLKGQGPEGFSLVLVISPLISLMIDQVISLRARGVAAAIVSGNKGVNKSLLATESDIAGGSFRVLLSAPEAIVGSDKWREVLLNPCVGERVVAVTVDEAHCVSKWFVLVCIHYLDSYP